MSARSYHYLKAIADTTRLRILSLIESHPDICVCQLIETLKMPQGTISKALGVLKRAGLVSDRRDGQWVRYSILKPDNGFPIKEIIASASEDIKISKDSMRLKSIKKIPLEKICCNKPWRK